MKTPNDRKSNPAQPQEGPKKFGYLAFYDDNAVVREVEGLTEKFDPTLRIPMGKFFGCRYCDPCDPPFVGETVLFELIGGAYMSVGTAKRDISPTSADFARAAAGDVVMKTGRVVRLKSGGAPMTVIRVFAGDDKEPFARACWFSQDGLEQYQFPVAALIVETARGE